MFFEINVYTSVIPMFCLVFYKQVLIDYLFLTIGDAFFAIKTLSNLVSYSPNSRLQKKEKCFRFNHLDYNLLVLKYYVKSKCLSEYFMLEIVLEFFIFQDIIQMK